MTSEQGIILDVTSGDTGFETRFLENLGHPVLVCHGPDLGTACPILKGGCTMVDRAHGVVFQVDLDRPQHRAILKRYQEVLASTSRCVCRCGRARKSGTGTCCAGCTWSSVSPEPQNSTDSPPWSKPLT